MILGKYSITLSNVIYFAFIITTLLISPSMCVKREDFKTCSQSGFCTRQRAYANLVDKTDAKNASPYAVIPNTIELHKDEGYITAKVLKTTSNDIFFNLKLYLLKNGSVRLNFEEAVDNIKTRFDVAPLVLDNNSPETYKDAKPSDKNNDKVVSYTFGEKDNETTIVLTLNPLKIELVREGEVVLAFNQNGYFNYEEHRQKSNENDQNTENENAEDEANNENAETSPEANAEANADAAQEVSEEEKQKQEEIKKLTEDVHKDMWEETFKSHTDSKPYGPESIGFDITFSGYKNVYGIPQHTGPLSLKTTRNGDEYNEPYRLYNLDVFEYIIDSPMAIYGAIPFMLGHKRNTSAGVLFVNSSEMWVDVEKDDVSTHTHWMAESGKMDVFLFVGKNPKDVVKKYMNITGKPQLPQYFAIAYHQCRWNYNDEVDVLTVDNKFDEYGIPYDVLWLDIEHTDGKRYFTWDYSKFPDPEKLQKKLASKGRKMVTIVDPHIKVDNDYYIYKEAKDQDFFIHDSKNKPFDGWCWPGSSSWVDFLNPKAFSWFTEQYKFDKYKGSTEYLYTWNDMNEPSVFSGPETTMPKDNLHYGNVEHRDVHNVYGELYHKATFEAHLVRNKSKDIRPFILSRAFFIGSQRYGAIWTGDNDAKWDHLKASLPMLLSIGVSGLPFCGADIGGFFNNPEKELYIRWYQAAAFQPFVRGHSHIETKRREPWLYDDETIALVRAALYERYNLLPYWYTLFKESSVNGLPMMRPMFLTFPEDENTFSMEDQFMAGDRLLVKPVTTQGQQEITVYLPKTSNWYNYMTRRAVQPDQNGYLTIPTDLGTIPVFIRGGSIIPLRLRHRRSSTAMRHDPYTLLIALDDNQEATGEFYIDDGKSGDFKRSFYIYRTFKYADHKLTMAKYQSETDVPESQDSSELLIISERIERLLLLGLDPQKVASIKFKFEDYVNDLEYSVDPTNDQLIIVKNPAVEIKDIGWSIEVEYK